MKKARNCSNLQKETFLRVLKVGQDGREASLPLLLPPGQFGPDNTGPGPGLVRLED